MAFHFNWSPLIADTDRVRHMLTASLNKSPKPPIIVDDIVVNELNLGSMPPSLEILEIGDLAEDRFRGIFKVKYEGDAYLTLRTKVQANPLNTFLSSKPSFASPNLVAAGSGLTIPLQITLSDIRLSGFVILVFSKQKGITLVFRNDPLESLKVSSTFDSIPFVRDYLQKTIEGQLRVLFMEDLPAIIHRLSLRVFNPEFEAPEREKEVQGAEPYESPSQRATSGDSASLPNPFSLDSQGETYANFSQNNLLRLAALAESQRTLSLFTPTMRDTVYRAWANRSDEQANTSPMPTLSRVQSMLNISHAHAPGVGSSGASHTSETAASHVSRPSLASFGTSVGTSTYSFANGRTRSHVQRKRKHRVFDLRKHAGDGAGEGLSDTVSVSSEHTTTESLSRSAGDNSTGPVSAEGLSTVPTSVSLRTQEREGEIQTPPRSPQKKVGFQQRQREEDQAGGISARDSGTIRQSFKPRTRPATPQTPSSRVKVEDEDSTPRASMYLRQEPRISSQASQPTEKRPERPRNLPRMQTMPSHQPRDKAPILQRSGSDVSISDITASAFHNRQSFDADQDDDGGASGGILEQAWMTKMATEIAKRVAIEKEREDAAAPTDKQYGRERSRRTEHGVGVEDAPPAYFS